MSTEVPAPAAEQNWGDPQPPRQDRPRWTARRTAVAVAIAAGIAVAGGAVVYAGTSGEPSQNVRMGGPAGAMPGLFDALHGDFVVSDGTGGYETQRMQTGEVAAIDDDSLTVESDDGYTQTYELGAGAGDTAERGDTVTVLATVSGDTATATSITSGEGGFPGGPQGRPPGQQGGPGGTN
ncbi:hypothetical protein [Prauserella flavalba]|uniref:hypothetical protein n=1 Tax=Prauserella flavalba TaxID=1477506 RepID=UPI0036E4D0D7